ncbi:MAG: helix-turn-helix transcriptional regulator [Armatimonadetes bacterium]|nr:helix-turn-helix transcriptional regulator [Armatimonadota bacterium]
MRSVRESVGVSQRELAKLLNLPQSYVSKIERGERQLQALELIEICRLLKVLPSEVLRSYLLTPGEQTYETNERVE